MLAFAGPVDANRNPQALTQAPTAADTSTTMPQQINLSTPVLLTQKRYFSAQTMLVSLGVFVLVGGAMAEVSAGIGSRIHITNESVLAFH